MERKADFSDLVGHWTPDPAFEEIVDRATDVFVVERVHAIAENQEEVKIIGVYSSRAAAEDAIERLKLKPWGLRQPRWIRD